MNAEYLRFTLEKLSAKDVGRTHDDLLRILKLPTTRRDPATGCFLRTANRNRFGYPLWRVRYPDGKKRQRHLRRDILELSGVDVTPGVPVVDTCGNKNCVNPDHLKNGTFQEKAIAAVKSGRRGGLVMTEELVREVRRLRDGGRTHQEIAEKFGLTFATVRSVARGKTWKWVK